MKDSAANEMLRFANEVEVALGSSTTCRSPYWLPLIETLGEAVAITAPPGKIYSVSVPKFSAPLTG